MNYVFCPGHHPGAAVDVVDAAEIAAAAPPPREVGGLGAGKALSLLHQIAKANDIGIFNSEGRRPRPPHPPPSPTQTTPIAINFFCNI